jgi:hypothetical protein
MPGGVGGAVPRGIPLSRSIPRESVNWAFGITRLHSIFDPLERMVEREFDAVHQVVDLGLGDDQGRA